MDEQQITITMTDIVSMNTDPVIKELLELVASVRNGSIVSLSYVATTSDGNVLSKKLCEPSLAALRSTA